MAAVPLPESDRLGPPPERSGDGDLATSPPPPPATARPPRRRHRRGAPRLRARKVQRVIRRVEPWSVLKLAGVFFICLWLVVTVAGLILWRIAEATGTVTNLESFLAELSSSESFAIDGGQILRASAIIGLVLVVAGTIMTMVLTMMFNFISELTGGIRLAVVELESAERVRRGRWWAPSRARRRAEEDDDAVAATG